MAVIDSFEVGGTTYDLNAAALETPATIDGISFDGNESVTRYAACATAGATAAKVVTLGTDLTLAPGATVIVRFNSANTAESPTLNVNGTGAFPIVAYGSTAAASGAWAAGEVVTFVYDGTNWNQIGGAIGSSSVYGRMLLDATLSVPGAAADAKITGDDINSLNTLIADRTAYEIDTTNFGWSYGGVTVKGAANDRTDRLRIIGPDGKGGIFVKQGSTITANEGYKFSCATYSSYISGANYELIAFRGMLPGYYIVPQDCYIRIAIGTENDDVLWEVGDEEEISLTQAGILAEANALTLDLIGGTVKDSIDEILASAEMSVSLIDPGDLPINAVNYYALWSSLVDEGFVTEETLDYAYSKDNDTQTAAQDQNLPICLYTMRTDMAHLAPGDDSKYEIIPWDGTNQTYDRPRVLIVSGMHGNERATPLAVYSFAERLCHDLDYQDLRNAFDWYFIPLVNPWGFSHTAYKNGVATNGVDYDGSATYTVEQNTTSVHKGIRSNLYGVDVNRCFSVSTGSGVPTSVESEAVMDKVNEINSDDAGFLFTLDAHQFMLGGTEPENAITAYCSVDSGATTAEKTLIFDTFMRSSATLERLASDTYNRTMVQTCYTWIGANTSEATFRNWIAEIGATDYSACMEGSLTCKYYTNNGVMANPEANKIVNTCLHLFLRKLAERLT